MDSFELEAQSRERKQKREMDYGSPGLIEILCEFSVNAGMILLVLKLVQVQPVAAWSWWKAAGLFGSAGILYTIAYEHRVRKLNSRF